MIDVQVVATSGSSLGPRDVGAAVVSQCLSDGDVLPGELGHCPAHEPDHGHRSLVGQDLDRGQPGGVIDGDMHSFPADAVALVLRSLAQGQCPAW